VVLVIYIFIYIYIERERCTYKYIYRDMVLGAGFDPKADLLERLI
jgi:hypothetical protein